MSSPIKKGDRAFIIRGALGSTGPNVGKEVTVGMMQHDHSQFGRIWEVHGEGLVNLKGETLPSVNCAADWLQKIEPDADQSATETQRKLTV